jgi:hypothetical protein
MNVRWLMPAYRVDVSSNGASMNAARWCWTWCMPWHRPTTESAPAYLAISMTLAVIGLL